MPPSMVSIASTLSFLLGVHGALWYFHIIDGKCHNYKKLNGKTVNLFSQHNIMSLVINALRGA